MSNNEITNKDLLKTLDSIKDNHLTHIEVHTKDTYKAVTSTNKILISIGIGLVIALIVNHFLG